MFPNKKKCLISQNTGCPIKTKEKKQSLIQGGSPWAALIFNSMLAVVVLYCVQLFFEANFPKSFFPLLCYSFCPLLSAFSFLASSPWFLLCFYGVSVKFLWNFYVSMIPHGVSKGVSVVVRWDSYEVSKGCLWDFLWIPMGFLWDFYDMSMGFLWGFHDISMGFPLGFYQVCMGSL